MTHESALPDQAAPALWRLSARALADGYRSGAFTPVAALESCLDRTRHCEPRINAFAVLDAQGARAAAQASTARFKAGAPLGPLDGIPVSVKDNMHVAGLPTGWGSRLLAAVRPLQDEAPIARLRAAGAVPIGKTTLSEFAMQGFCSNDVTGTTRNPWDPALTPGGSSGGAVASVAAGCTPLAVGTDGGGSTRRPASHCGLVGFKPSIGLIGRSGGLPELFLDYEVVGAIAREMGDAVALTEALSGSPLALPASRPARILFIPRFGDNPVDEAISARMCEAAAQFRALGHQVEEASDFALAEPVNAVWTSLSAIGLAWMIDSPEIWPEIGHGADQPPDITLCRAPAQDSYRQGHAAKGSALFDILATVAALKRGLAALFRQHDYLLTPATACLPWTAEASHPDEIAGQSVGPRGHAVFTGFANAAGLPAIALPYGMVEGLPTGFQLVGPHGADAALLALALQYEAAHPWHALRPAL